MGGVAVSAIGMGRAAANANVKPLNGAQTDYLGKLVQYIPADIVAGYVAVFALADSGDNNRKAEWIVAYVFLALTPFVVITTFVGQVHKAQRKWPSLREWPWFKIIIGMVAYVAWVFALPNTPMLDWGDVTGFAQTLVLVVTTIVLAGLGQVFNDA
jgi:hypothetical protein